MRYSVPTAAFLMIAISATVMAQEKGVIRGVVVTDDGKPIAGATVRVAGTTRGAITRADGTFVIQGVPVGDYNITVTSIGYSVDSQTIHVAEDVAVELRAEMRSKFTTPFGCFGWRPPLHTGTVRSVRFDDPGSGLMTSFSKYSQGFR